jgi:anti-sigma B factor antagonist/stage II sporulation protein AA (anti-sigma F factor antagonist)
MPMARFHVTRLAGERELRLSGELDMEVAHELERALAALPRSGQATLDLSELTFIDSTGLHAIMEFACAQNGNGAVVIKGLSAPLARLFEITNISGHPSVDIRAETDGS